MELAVYPAEPLCGNVSVYLSRAYLRVAEQFLYDAKIRAVLEKMRRETVPESVRCDTPCNAGGGAEFFDYLPHAHPAERGAGGVAKQIIPFSGRRGKQKSFHSGRSLIAHRDDSFFASFPQAFEKTHLRIDIFHP